ncbi:hypothetical protein THASP1DRAFT_30379 [Thamnocephalis sphaerospora]|uniref:Uncharacterized protein n=1 Tax=Thamnocephalis sphaerospora TaxID=78915 RepID=A0A4P9XQM5_9FUNG|nr:hypothetical protein THASP1DRAFT_30379 [Thamnocephalis sphaerospora]|eukprot:RKP07801.1 hypothetical protein THASP1DRAFT_30379 [Thamnocephalis sphaerospora]
MQQAERLAEELLMEKQLLVEYDRRRNDNRVALNHMRSNKDKKIWMNLGDLFIRLPKKTASHMLESEQTQLDTSIEETRRDVRDKAQQLDQLEGGDGSRFAAFDLRPVSSGELRGATGGRAGDGRAQ